MASILLIEKNKETRSNWAQLLGFLKNYVLSTNEFKVTNKFNYDVVVADTDIVGIDGLELLAVFHNDEIRTPVIFTSASDVPNRILESDEEIAGIAYLRKPFPNYVLQEHIDKALRYQNLIKSNPDSLRPIARLVIEQPETITTELLLRRCYTFGRYRSTDTVRADVRLNSRNASRKHAILIRIYRGKESFYRLIDYSSNGVLVNGVKIKRCCTLQHGDQITFYPGSIATYTLIDRNASDLDTTLTQPENQ